MIPGPVFFTFETGAVQVEQETVGDGVGEVSVWVGGCGEVRRDRRGEKVEGGIGEVDQADLGRSGARNEARKTRSAGESV